MVIHGHSWLFMILDLHVIAIPKRYVMFFFDGNSMMIVVSGWFQGCLQKSQLTGHTVTHGVAQPSPDLFSSDFVSASNHIETRKNRKRMRIPSKPLYILKFIKHDYNITKHGMIIR